MQKADAATRPRSPLRPMICTSCPACAAPLPHTNAKQCSRCKTRYCGPECQKQHWEEGGHDKLCRKIRKSGGAEQYYANNKYAEAVAVAVEECAEDTKGQTCYICMETVHSRTGEGLVRGCGCGDRDGVASGRTGIAHVSCLAEQAKILVAEAEDNNLGAKVLDERWTRWAMCSLCKQDYHGVVRCALGWACWKTYLGLPETDQSKCSAMSVLGNGLNAAKHHEDALPVVEAALSMLRRIGAPTSCILAQESNLALMYRALGRDEQALRLKRDVYYGYVKLLGEEHEETLLVAENYALSLIDLRRFEEAKALLRKTILVAQRVQGKTDARTLKLQATHATALYSDDGATLDDVREAVMTLAETASTMRRVLADAHPNVAVVQATLRESRAVLRARESDGRVSIREALEAMTPGMRNARRSLN